MANKANNIFLEIMGNWTGASKIFLEPHELHSSGETKISISQAINNQNLRIEYSHVSREKPYDAILLVHHNSKNDQYQGAWLDEWHQSHEIMQLNGRAIDYGFKLEGSYAGGDEVWGWEIEITHRDAILTMNHYNIMPNRERYLGFENLYNRE